MLSPIWTYPSLWLMTGPTVGEPQVKVGKVPIAGPPGVAAYVSGLLMGDATRNSPGGGVAVVVEVVDVGDVVAGVGLTIALVAA